MYANGTGVAQDHTEAVRLYRLAADQSARAQVNLGRMYEDGTGVSQDHTEAVRFYRLAADQGYATAQCYLGMMYCDGTGIPQDLAKAAWLFKLAVAGEVAGVMVMTPLFSSPVFQYIHFPVESPKHRHNRHHRHPLSLVVQYLFYLPHHNS